MAPVQRHVALALALASCAGPPRYAEPAPGPPADVSIAPSDAEIWAWQTDLGGVVPAGVVSCRVRAPRGAAAIDAHVEAGRWSARVALGSYDDPFRAECIDSFGRLHVSPAARLRARLRDAPAARIAETRLAEGDVVLDASPSTPSERSQAPVVGFAWRVEPGCAAQVEGAGRRVRVRVPAADRPCTIEVTVRDANDATDRARVDVGPKRPLRDDVVYGIVPPLFGERPLRAVTSALDDLADLGAGVLWLSPIFETPPGDYGYAVTDYFLVRKGYGTFADLVELVGEAHRRGLRVVLDLVPNHTSEQHRYFREASALGRASHYFDFYERDAEGRPEHYFDWANLPNLRYENPEVGRWILEAARHWMQDARIDGFRIDAAWGIEQRSPGFWDSFRDDVRRIDAGALLVAEASARDPFWRDHGFDAAYDWNEELGHWAWRDAWKDPDTTADALDADVRASPTHVLRFLENNDTGPRFVTRHGPDLTRVAAAALFTLPGTPALFTGQERGAEYEPYAKKTRLPPGDPDGLRPWYRSLVALRRSIPALRADGYARARVEGADRRVLAYVRHDRASKSVALVVLRFDGKPLHARIALPAVVAGRRAWRDALGGSGATVAARDGALEIDLAPWAARVLVAAE